MPATATARTRRVVIDFQEPLFNETEHAATALGINRSSLIREAVKLYLERLQRQKLEKELAEGYVANAASASAIANDMMGAERDFA